MRKAAFQRSLLALQHLCRLETFIAATQERFDVRCDVLWTKPLVDVVIASGAESSHQGLVASIAHGEDGNRSGFGITVHDARKLERTELAQVRGAQDRSRRIPLQHCERVSSVSAV